MGEEKKTTVVWHPATESPGKRRVLMAFTRKDLKPNQYLFRPVRLFSLGLIPAEGRYFDSEGNRQQPVAWAYYDEVIKGITERMCKNAAARVLEW